ncbi:AbrB/MazE/SpoVT family DNA-binding domain-containing protein [Burkholderia vietnamiensis]|nr:AbrB/MazE/SpoVT family DNA-binding domain-containing protein [Burkholderia vietnamiensis]
MKVLIEKWGNSASVRIPVAVMAASRLAVDQIVDVREEGGRIVIEPIRENGLEMLVAGITSANMHGEVSFGLAVGKEEVAC